MTEEKLVERVTALFADSDAAQRKMIRLYAETNDAIEASAIIDSGAEVLHMLQGGLRPEVLVLDSVLSDTTIFPLLRSIRQQQIEYEPHIIVTLMPSAAPQIEKILTLGAECTIFKPYSLPELFDTVYQTAASGPRLNRYLVHESVTAQLRTLGCYKNLAYGINYLQEAVDTILAGAQKKNKILSDKEKCIVAYHEVGHAMVAALQSHSAPVQKITIVPRTSGALGFTMQVEDGDHTLMTKEEILAKIATMTGGRAAEEVVFNSITTGASNDIEQATKMARAMITRYGMTDDFDMVALETVNNAYLGGDASLACSERTAATVDDKVVEVVKQQHEKAKQMLIENRGKLDEIAKYLYEKETITGEEFMRILTAVPQLPTGAVEQ